MAEETMKQGLGGVQYDTSKVFDPSKNQTTNESKAPAIAGGLPVTQNQGISTTAGSNYYAGMSMPSGNSPTIAGPLGMSDKTTAAQPIAGGRQTIAGAGDTFGKSATPLGMPNKAEPIAGVNTFSFDRKQPAGGIVANNSRNDWSAGSDNVKAAIAGSAYDEQVAKAKEINANTMQSLGNISDKQKFDMSFVGDARSDNPSYRNAMLTRQQWEKNNANSQEVLSRGKDLSIAGIKLAGDRYKTDQDLSGEKYKADQHLAGVKLQSDAEVAKSVVAGREKAQQQQQQPYADRVKGLVSGWEKLNVPTEVAPKLAYYAHLHAQAEDPKGNVFMMPPNREGGMYTAVPKQYEAHYQNLQQSMPVKDAVARIYAVAKQNGHAIDVPDFNRFQTKQDATKNMAFGG